MAISLLLALTAHGQELAVKSIRIDASDITASTQRRLGPDGKPCALLKIQAVEIITGVDGDVAVGDLQRIGTTTWIYVPAGTFGITLTTEKNGTIDINFEDYGYEGEGIIHECHCANCGAQITYWIPINNEETEP